MLLLKMEEMSKIGHDSADQGRQATC
jgi:hypothetical protein